MSDDLVKRIKDRGDWLVDAVATATQNRMFLRGEPECDDVACDAIRMNGEKAMSQIAKPLADRIEALEAKLAKAVEALTPSGDTKAEYMGEFHFSQTMIGEDGDEVTVKTYVPWTTIKKIMAAINARATLAEIKGKSHE